MDKRYNLARIALLGACAVLFLTAIGCGSSGESSAGANVSPANPQKGVKKGSKRDASAFISTQ